MALKCSALMLRSCLVRNLSRTLTTNAQNRPAQNGGQSDFPGARVPFTSDLKFLSEESYDQIPAYRVLDNSGSVVDASEDPRLDRETLTRMYKTMTQLNQMDKILYESQRQGRISFYMTNYGEEGIHVGSAAALQPQDVIFAQYREVGVLLYRGYSVRDIVNQCFGNHADAGKGRQMPVHYGCKELNFVTISSPLATQMPQAVGAAYAYKRVPNNERVVVCYFGDGAASEGDAHAAFNFAATLEVPIIFLCRNNGFAISTPTSEQYRGDGIASHGPAYGLSTVRVDGTDPLAMYNAVRAARQHALGNNKPVLVEAMAYRVGHHSTSDDSSAYRKLDDVAKWASDDSPIQKLRLYLEKQGWWSAEEEVEDAKQARSLVLRTMQESEKLKKPNWREMFEDVYYDMPPHLQKQMRSMEEHLEKYGEHYPLDQYQTDN